MNTTTNQKELRKESEYEGEQHKFERQQQQRRRQEREEQEEERRRREQQEIEEGHQAQRKFINDISKKL